MNLKHNWLVLVPSKGRPAEFEKTCKPLLETLPIDSAVILEEDDYENYDHPNKILLDKTNQGVGYAIHFGRQWAEANGYDVIFKIDDDVKKIGKIHEDLEAIDRYLAKYDDLAGVSFPYSFEFYDITKKKLFSHINKRFQTCYIIKTKYFKTTERIRQIEDFFYYMMAIRQNGWVLRCSKHAIETKAVGSNEGGCQSFDRAQMYLDDIKVFLEIDPSIKVIEKPDKSWRYEPKLTDPMYKARKI
jgi:hypothetical protein